MNGAFRAPQLGLWGTMPPKTDNPAAAGPVPCPLAVKARIDVLRAEALARAQAACRAAPLGLLRAPRG